MEAEWSKTLRLLLSDVSSIIQFHLDIEINVTDKSHFVFVYLLDYSLYSKWHKNRLYIVYSIFGIIISWNWSEPVLFYVNLILH